MSPFRILVPLDGTPLSNASLVAMKALARPLQAEVLLARVVPEGSDEQVVAEARRHLDGVAGEVQGINIPVQVAVAVGDATDQILRQVRDSGVDLVVMAARRKGIERLLLGSVASEVVRRCPVPVVVVRPGGRRVTAVRRILLPLDEDADSARILPLVERLGLALGAEVVLLRVLPAFSVPQADWLAGGTQELLEQDRAQAEQALGQIAAQLAQRGLRVRSLIGQTPVPDTILAAVETEQADLVALATHARGGLERALLGSVADEVIHHSPVPVLTLSLAASRST